MFVLEQRHLPVTRTTTRVVLAIHPHPRLQSALRNTQHRTKPLYRTTNPLDPTITRKLLLHSLCPLSPIDTNATRPHPTPTSPAPKAITRRLARRLASRLDARLD
jgi:hypothetical protein